jgi:hypothetical protein
MGNTDEALCRDAPLEASSQNSPAADVSAYKIWTFVLKGGNQFSLSVDKNPKLVHDGGVTLWKLAGTVALADLILRVVTEVNSTGTVERYTEEENEEQVAERKRLIDGDEP